MTSNTLVRYLRRLRRSEHNREALLPDRPCNMSFYPRKTSHRVLQSSLRHQQRHYSRLLRCNVGAKNGTNRVTLGCPIVPLIGSVCFISFQAAAPTIKAVCILDGDGGRICSKYYCADWPSFDKQQAFEKVHGISLKNFFVQMEAYLTDARW